MYYINMYKIPGKNPGLYLWNETVRTFPVALNASSTPEQYK